MAYSQHVEGKQRHRPQRRTRPPSLSDPLDWEQAQHPTLDSLPYRTRPRAADVDIQMPDSASRRTQYSASLSHRGRRASEDLHENMPPHSANPRRSRTVTHRKDSFAHADEDEELSTGRQRRARSRMRHRARSRSHSSSGSERSTSSRSEIVLAPSRSARMGRSAAVSRRASRSASSRSSSSSDSASTMSTQNEVQEILRRRRDEIEVLPDPDTTVHRRHHRKHKDREPVVYEEEPLQISRHIVVSESREAPRRRNKHHSNSRSRSRRRHHQHHHQDQLVKSSGSKRGHKKYYASDSGYVGRSKLPRSSGSQVASVHSVSTSSRRSSSAMNKFFYGQSPKSQKLVDCVACMDEGITSSKAAKLKCKHYMCHACLRRVFKVSIKNPQSMPPKCCTEDPIPVKHVDQLFETSFKKTWNRKFAEYSTRNRLYCPSSKCGEWIKPNRIEKLRDGRKVARCSHCKTDVCVACRGRSHRSKDCPGDAATNELLEQAKELGWQQCFDCGQLVELKEGCNHMTCRCGAEFCMICGIKWKSCECPWFNYDAFEADQLDDFNVPASIRSERERRPVRDSRAGKSSRHRPSSSYEEELSLRRVQERHDEDFARQLQYEDDDDNDDDDEEDDFVIDVMAVGNSAGHFMNDDYRRAPRVIPAAPSPPMQAVDRPGAGDYVSGVNKARGVRAHSLERRLADRFSESRQGTSPTHRAYNMSVPSPGPPMMGIPVMGQPPPPPLAPGIGHLRRAHTMDEEMYGTPSRSRLSERISPGHARADYDVEPDMYPPSSRRRQRGREREQPSGNPPGSVLAGLTGPGSGMNRVDEWRKFVVDVEPESGIAVH